MMIGLKFANVAGYMDVFQLSFLASSPPWNARALESHTSVVYGMEERL